MLRPYPALEGNEEAVSSTVHHATGFSAFAKRLGHPAIRAALAALLLIAISVLPVTAASAGPTSLVNAEVDPRTATTTTTITFAVTFRNSQGGEPSYVRVQIGGAVHEMRPSTDSQDWKKGGRFVYQGKLKAGTYVVQFLASDEKRHEASIGGGSVTVTPAPTPEADPEGDAETHAQADPEAHGQAIAPGAHRATRHACAQGGFHEGGAAPDAEAHAHRHPRAEPRCIRDGRTELVRRPDHRRAAARLDRPGRGRLRPRQRLRSHSSRGGFGGRGNGPGDAALPGCGRHGPVRHVDERAPGHGRRDRRRHDGDGVPRVRQEAAQPAAHRTGRRARRERRPGAGLAPNASFAKVVAPNAAAVATAVQAAVAAPLAAGTSDIDGHMPRWRRPSLMEARKADPTPGHRGRGRQPPVHR